MMLSIGHLCPHRSIGPYPQFLRIRQMTFGEFATIISFHLRSSWGILFIVRNHNFLLLRHSLRAVLVSLFKRRHCYFATENRINLSTIYHHFCLQPNSASEYIRRSKPLRWSPRNPLSYCNLVIVLTALELDFCVGFLKDFAMYTIFLVITLENNTVFIKFQQLWAISCTSWVDLLE